MRLFSKTNVTAPYRMILPHDSLFRTRNSCVNVCDVPTNDVGSISFPTMPISLPEASRQLLIRVFIFCMCQGILSFLRVPTSTTQQPAPVSINKFVVIPFRVIFNITDKSGSPSSLISRLYSQRS